jgi:hypothetical protein
MHPDYRKGLLSLQAMLDQLIADVENLTASECDDDSLLGATKALGDLTATRAEVEGQLRAGD